MVLVSGALHYHPLRSRHKGRKDFRLRVSVITLASCGQQKGLKFDPPEADKCLLAFGEFDVLFFITKSPKDETTKIRSMRGVRFSYPIKTRRASQQGAEKVAVTV